VKNGVDHNNHGVVLLDSFHISPPIFSMELWP